MVSTTSSTSFANSSTTESRFSINLRMSPFFTTRVSGRKLISCFGRRNLSHQSFSSRSNFNSMALSMNLRPSSSPRRLPWDSREDFSPSETRINPKMIHDHDAPPMCSTRSRISDDSVQRRSWPGWMRKFHPKYLCPLLILVRADSIVVFFTSNAPSMSTHSRCHARLSFSPSSRFRRSSQNCHSTSILKFSSAFLRYGTSSKLYVSPCLSLSTSSSAMIRLPSCLPVSFRRRTWY